MGIKRQEIDDVCLFLFDFCSYQSNTMSEFRRCLSPETRQKASTLLIVHPSTHAVVPKDASMRS